MWLISHRTDQKANRNFTMFLRKLILFSEKKKERDRDTKAWPTSNTPRFPNAYYQKTVCQNYTTPKHSINPRTHFKFVHKV